VRWHRRLLAVIGKSDSATPQDFWLLLAAYQSITHRELPNWSEWQHLNAVDLHAAWSELEGAPLPVSQSYPDWLNALFIEQLGDRWPAVAEALNRQAPLTVRVNTLKTSVAQMTLDMDEWSPQQTSLSDVGLVLNHRGNLFATPWFKNGLIEVQDAGSQAIGAFVGVQPGMRVVDACAGAGGKTLHLASLMHNKGQIIALDVERWKLDELRRRVQRNGVAIVETRLIDTTKVVKRLYGSADRLLLDVPCSGLGVLRRNPDAKWRLSTNRLEGLLRLQADILQRYAPIVKPGGQLVYATCSLLPRENEQQVAAFLLQNPGYRLLAEQHISPVDHNADGFYMARIERVT
jgi:16S rRNA (cytosine967-C5)-methyltransferase